jgi:hypothetical protein
VFCTDVDVLFDSFTITVDIEPAADEQQPDSPQGATFLFLTALMICKLIGGASPHCLLQVVFDSNYCLSSNAFVLFEID